jgi:nitrogen fixation protein NifZ
MEYRFEFGRRVRVIRTVRSDGTYPGLDRGDKLVSAGSVGVVRNVGLFLQDQVIYTVHFTEEDRHVGCRESELIDADDDWVATRFEFRQKVRTRRPLGVRDEVVVQRGQVGQVTRVVREAAGEPAYQVHFDGRTFQVPESALQAAEPA